MQPSSLIFVVIAGVWAAFLVQHWIRRREHIATARSVDAFSETLRVLKVRDHGMGVAVEMLPNLIKPFFRGDAARTAATGAGLGLAIVDKTVQRMGGIFALANTTSGGLAAHIKLQKPKKT